MDGSTYITILATVTAFGMTWSAIPSIINVCNKKKLFDTPNNRKTHTIPTPTMGGLAIFAGYIFSVTFWSKQNQIQELQYIIASTLILFFMGLKDDLIEISAPKKLLGQILSALIIVLFADIRFTSLYGIFGVYEIPYLFSIFFSTFTILAVTNSFNLIDGIDGLAATIGILSLLFFGSWFHGVGLYQYSILSFSLIGSLFAFLFYNRHPAKIFMGDTGSLLLGIICSLLSIKFVEVNKTLNITSTFKIFSGPVIGITILIVPLFDISQVFFRRIFEGRSPFSPDRSHLHHRLGDLNLGPMQICMTLVFSTLSLLAISFLMQNISPELNVGIIFSICALSLIGINYMLNQKVRNNLKSKNE